MRDLAAKAIVPSIKTRRRTVRRRAHDRARGNDTNRLTVCKPGQGSRIYAKHRARLLDRYSDAEHVSPLPHRVSSALICSLWYKLLCRHRQPFLLGKVAAAVADSLRKPPSLERVRSPGIQRQGRGPRSFLVLGPSFRRSFCSFGLLARHGRTLSISILSKTPAGALSSAASAMPASALALSSLRVKMPKPLLR